MSEPAFFRDTTVPPVSVDLDPELPTVSLAELATAPITLAEDPTRAIHLLLFKIKHELGMDIQPVDPEHVLTRRMVVLDTESKIIKDEAQIVDYGRRINAYLQEHHPAIALSPDDLKILDLANLTSDTGKSGPAHANEEQLQYISKIYSIDDFTLPDSDQPVPTASLEDFCRAFFPHEADAMLSSLAELGVPKIHPLTQQPLTMRAFYNLHASWTYSLLKQIQIPESAMQAAVNHHMLEGYPKDVINRHDGTFMLGDNKRAINPIDVLVILLDKYDARLRRGGTTHHQAIQYLRELVNNETITSFRNASNPGFEILNQLPSWVRTMFNEYITYIDAALNDTMPSIHVVDRPALDMEELATEEL